jgi:hypothetical protein
MAKLISMTFIIILASCTLAANSNMLYRESRMKSLPKLVVGKLKSNDLHLNKIVIGKSTFDEVMATFGKTELIKNSIEHGNNRLCYRSSNDSDNTVLLLETGSMGGWKRVTTFSITNSKLWKQTARCKSSSLINRNLATASGLQIGTFASELINRFGKPTINNGKFIGYYLTAQENDWTYTSIIEAALEKDKVVSITVHQIATN